mgnify:CR=1 FL=1
MNVTQANRSEPHDSGSEELASSILDAALVVDEFGAIVTANDKAADLFGHPSCAMTGMQVSDVLSVTPDWPGDGSVVSSVQTATSADGKRFGVRIVPVSCEVGSRNVRLLVISPNNSMESRAADPSASDVFEKLDATIRIRTSLDETFEEVAESVRSIIPFDRFNITTFDIESGLAGDQFVKGLGPPAAVSARPHDIRGSSLEEDAN